MTWWVPPTTQQQGNYASLPFRGQIASSGTLLWWHCCMNPQAQPAVNRCDCTARVTNCISDHSVNRYANPLTGEWEKTVGVKGGLSFNDCRCTYWGRSSWLPGTHHGLEPEVVMQRWWSHPPWRKGNLHSWPDVVRTGRRTKTKGKSGFQSVHTEETLTSPKKKQQTNKKKFILHYAWQKIFFQTR